MCGIVGFYRFKDGRGRIDFENMVEALKECQTRGSQATGIYSPSTGVIKGALCGRDFARVRQEAIEKALGSRMLIAHCRTATGGFNGTYAGPEQEGNNHPHESDNYILVHNGHFGEIPKIKDYPYRGECDSELAVSYLETFGVQKALELFHDMDSYSLVFVHKKSEKLYFYRHKNPLVYSIDKQAGLLLFASVTSIVAELMLPDDDKRTMGFNILRGTPFLSTSEDFLYTISSKGLEKCEEIKPRLLLAVLESQPANILGKLDMDDFLDKKYPSRNSRKNNVQYSEKRTKSVEMLIDGLDSFKEEIFAMIVCGEIKMYSPAHLTDAVSTP